MSPVHNANHAGGAAFKERVPADYVTALLAKRGGIAPTVENRPVKLSAKIYGVMTLTAALTFVSLVQGYELFFTHPLYA